MYSYYIIHYLLSFVRFYCFKDIVNPREIAKCAAKSIGYYLLSSVEFHHFERY